MGDIVESCDLLDKSADKGVHGAVALIGAPDWCKLVFNVKGFDRVIVVDFEAQSAGRDDFFREEDA